jgi:hypothetical protein
MCVCVCVGVCLIYKVNESVGLFAAPAHFLSLLLNLINVTIMIVVANLAVITAFYPFHSYTRISGNARKVIRCIVIVCGRRRCANLWWSW